MMYKSNNLNQQYCLRWNNHGSNVLISFGHLFHTEAFTDVTLACEGHSIKCHKIVLAACSSYFTQLFLDNDCRHPIVILKDILFSEVKAILEYMYRGEVNVAQDQLSGLLKAAETLRVKGLVEETQQQQQQQREHGGRETRGGSSPPYGGSGGRSDYENMGLYGKSLLNVNNVSSGGHMGGHGGKYGSAPPPPPPHSHQETNSYEMTTTPPERVVSSVPYSSWAPKQQQHPNTPPSSTTLPSPKQTPPPPLLLPHLNNNSYEPHDPSSGPQVFKKKKYMSAGGSKDTPILRTVLGHTGSSHLERGVNYSMGGGGGGGSTNGPTDPGEKGLRESPDTYLDDSIRSVESDKMHEDNQHFSFDSSEDKHALGQKPEWKRYKQYTRSDIMAAIEAVRAGMSALQAARKYGVPSRTLYDKVKKLGITTNRPYRKGSFPMSPYQGLKMEEGYSPEEPLNVSSTGNGNGSLSLQEGDSDKMDSDPGSSIKQEHSPHLDDLEPSPPPSSYLSFPLHHQLPLQQHGIGHGEEGGGPENGGASSSDNCSSSTPSTTPYISSHQR